VIEELSRVSGAMGAMAQASQLGVAKVMNFGSEPQKARWLPGFATGELLPTIAVTEPESGGHVLGMSSSAIRDGDDYVLNGRKCFVGNSHIGDVHGVVVRTGAGSRGLTAFLVERHRPGLRLGDPGRPAGLHGFSYGELIFEDCRVPAENRIGDEGGGLDVAYSSSTLYGRPNLTAVALGIHQAIVEDTVAFCRRRELGNLLVRDGRLAAVLDFGSSGVGDPACDTVIAWTFLSGPSRDSFRAELGADEGMWSRGRGWALWKALITLDPDAPADAPPRRDIAQVLADFRR
jgi:acyl-CoA dehydrogenase